MSRAPGSTRRGGRPRRDERGATLVEAAIVTPLLLLVVFGILEFGFLFKDVLTLNNGTRAGARVASAAGSDPLADYNVLKALEGATASLSGLETIVVYEANGPDGEVPASCLSGVGQPGLCNVYAPADLSITQVQFEDPGYTKDDWWPATDRETSQSAPGGPDYLGVYLQSSHDSVTNLILQGRTLTDSTVMRLEPTR